MSTGVAEVKRLITPLTKEAEDEVVHYEVGLDDGQMVTTYEPETDQQYDTKADNSVKDYYTRRQQSSSTKNYIEKGGNVKTTVCYPYGGSTTHVINSTNKLPTTMTTTIKYEQPKTAVQDERPTTSYVHYYESSGQKMYQYQTVASPGFTEEQQQPIRLVSTVSQERVVPIVHHKTFETGPGKHIATVRRVSSSSQEHQQAYVTETRHVTTQSSPYEMNKQLSSSISKTDNMTCTAENLEAAIACGRIYAPLNAAFVPGEVVKHAGIATTYDSILIPTFENDLEVDALPRILPVETHQPTQEIDNKPLIMIDQVQPKEETTKFVKKVAHARSRMRCC